MRGADLDMTTGRSGSTVMTSANDSAGQWSSWPCEARKGVNPGVASDRSNEIDWQCWVAELVATRGQEGSGFRIYCADPCSCQGCLNRPEYEDTVLETRQQIESRNPLAFLPKVVQRTTDSPSNNMEDANLMTLSSQRHKRGCNCKWSMCLNCECYQANVGCSSGCRCEGCKNAYGRKEDYVAKEHALSKEMVSSRVETGSDSTFHNKLEMVASKTNLLQTELYDPQRLLPLTPSLQCSKSIRLELSPEE